MKKFLVLVVLSLMTVTALAYNGTEVKAAIVNGITTKNLTTYEAIKTEVETVVNATDLPSPQIKRNTCLYLTAVFTSRYGNAEEFKKAFTALRTNKRSTFEFTLKAQRIYGWTNEETYNFVMQQFRENNNSASVYQFGKGVEIIIKYGPIVNVTTQKADLQLLNRLASPKLLKNKAEWEPIVAKIRTALETY